MPEDPAGPGTRVGVRTGPQLLTYPDSFGGDLASIRALLDGPLAGLFGGIHILPPFPSSADHVVRRYVRWTHAANCWRSSAVESAVMWSAYAPRDGVVVRSNFPRLTRGAG